jgi:hypothetical protein
MNTNTNTLAYTLTQMDAELSAIEADFTSGRTSSQGARVLLGVMQTRLKGRKLAVEILIQAHQQMTPGLLAFAEAVR